MQRLKLLLLPRKQQRTKEGGTMEEDGLLDVLIEWLTTEGHHSEHCGANLPMVTRREEDTAFGVSSADEKREVRVSKE